MKKCYSFLTALFLATVALAQNDEGLSGRVYDSVYKRPVADATVTVLEKQDSSLVSFTMTDGEGRFAFKNIRPGEYRLLITHSNYYHVAILFAKTANKPTGLGDIVMGQATKTLGEVILQSESPPVTLIDDTVQYNAGSFKTPPNANVEQLLKKLPGVKVEKDGTVRAQGERVNRVLVDGKEFFGNDPAIATKNLPADAVDKVQVYDRQSDQAQLTGFEDGNYEKTINLKLKKDKKKGMFGKASGGVGNNGRYEGRVNMNSFKGARQLSALGMGNNTNAAGFTFMDILNFTGELGRLQRNGNGNVNVNFSDNDAEALGIIGGNRNTGIRTTWGGGINYNNIIGNKTDLQSNYFYNNYKPKTESDIQRQYFLPDYAYFYNQQSFAVNSNINHRLNLNVLYQFDSMNAIRVTPSFNWQKTNNRSQNNYETMAGNRAKTNEGFSNNALSNEGFNFRNDIVYRKKLKRKGRTFSLALQTSLNQSAGDGGLQSINSFYNTGGVVIRKDTLNQLSNIAATLGGYIARITYTEPLLKRSLLEFSISKSYTASTSEKITYDYNRQNGKHDQVNSLLTNDYNNVYEYINTGIRFRTKKRKYLYVLGATLQQATMEGKAMTQAKDSLINKRFANILPNARFQYNFSRFKSLSVDYNVSTNQPDISQLQPIPDNSNSLNIREGNPDLRQEYIHAIRGNLNLVSPYKNKNFFLFFNMQATQNKIVNSDSINQSGIKRTKPVNVNGVYNLNGNISYGLPLPSLKINLEISSNVNFYKGKQFINSNENHIRAWALGPAVRLDMNPHARIDISLEAELNYNNTSYSLAPALNTKYFQQVYSTSFDWEIPKRFFLSTDFIYTINSGRVAGFNNKVPLWNAHISKQVMNFNRGEIKLSAIDLLNSNIGISRNSSQNYIEDSRINTLRQYFLLSFNYSLSKTGLNNAGGGMRMITR